MISWKKRNDWMQGATKFAVCFIVFFGHLETASADREIYENTLSLRGDYRMGVGGSVGGILGLAAVNIELNIEDQDGVVAGFGRGPVYNSFGMLWKHVFNGDYISTYSKVGMSRWYNSIGNIDTVNSQSPTLNRAMGDKLPADGRFACDFIVGALGIQYTQLAGEARGNSFFMEVDLLASTQNFSLIPSGSVGYMYYF